MEVNIKCPVCGNVTDVVLWKDFMYAVSTGRTSNIDVDVKVVGENEYDLLPVYEAANKRVMDYEDKEFTLASKCTHRMFGSLLPDVGAFCKKCGASLNKRVKE